MMKTFKKLIILKKYIHFPKLNNFIAKNQKFCSFHKGRKKKKKKISKI